MMAVTGPDELLSFLSKFTNLWHSGKNAQLSMECQDGVISVNLRLNLDSQPPAPQHPTPPAQRLRQPGPSRARRSARRAQARAEAAADAAVSSKDSKAAEDAAVAPDPSVPRTYEAAVQAVPLTQEAAVQAASCTKPLFNAAVQADGQQQQDQNVLHHRPLLGAAGALPPSSAVKDVFCPDKDFMMASMAENQHERQVRMDRQAEERRLDLQKFQKMVEDSLNVKI